MTNRIRNHMTPKRLAWLQRLTQGPAERPFSRGPVGFQCYQLGWTEWVRDPTTGHLTTQEQLTDLGRSMIALATTPADI